MEPCQIMAPYWLSTNPTCCTIETAAGSRNIAAGWILDAVGDRIHPSVSWTTVFTDTLSVGTHQDPILDAGIL